MAARDETPDGLGVWLTALAAAVSVLAVGVAPAPAGLALVALAVLSIGVHRGSRRFGTIGATGLFGAVLLAGVLGAPVGRMLTGTAAAVVAWDASDHAIGLGTQVGDSAQRRAHLVHVGGSAVTAAVVAGLAFAVYRVANAGQPTTAVVLLLLAALVFAWLLDSY